MIDPDCESNDGVDGRVDDADDAGLLRLGGVGGGGEVELAA